MGRREWLVGHDQARAVVEDLLRGARAGAGDFLLVSGEPGVGKSALLSWLAERAAPAAQVLRGFCWEGGGAPPYWPWTQVLRATGLPACDLGEATRLLELSEPADPEGPDGAAVADAARFRLFDAVATSLATLAGTRPVVVTVDDLHWADDASLDLLSFVARAAPAGGVLLVGAYRDAEASPGLRRLAAQARDVPLTGLSRTEVTALVESMPGPRLRPELVDQLWERSGGNPLFVRELARLVRAEDLGGPPGHLPVGIVETVRRRLARLSTDCVRLLDRAAVAGAAIDVPLLVAVGGAPDESTARDLLAQARDGGIVSAAGSPRFVHDLHRQAIIDAQPAALNARINLALARALQGRARPGEAARTAGHLLRAGAAVQDEAVEWSVRAAREATARLGHDDACRHLRRALSSTGASDRRLEVLLELSAALARTGGADAARAHLREAATLGRRLDDAVALGRAALGLQALGQRTAAQYAEVLDVLRDAADRLADTDAPPGLRSRVAAATAVCLRHRTHGPGAPELVDVARGAAALAEQAGDPAARAAAQLALHDAMWRPGGAADRLAVVESMGTAARQARDADLVAQARLLRAAALIEQGDPAGRAELLGYVGLAENLGHARGRWGALSRRATYAQVAGRAADAAELGARALELGQAIGEPDALGVFYASRFSLVALGVPDPPGTLGDADPMWPLRPLILAWPSAVRGELATAREVLGDFSVRDVPISTDLEVMSVAAVVFAAVGSTAQRRQVYDLLLPYAGTHVVVGGCAAYHAAVDHHLGVLAAALGDHAAAGAHLSTALDMHQRLGAAGWSRLTADALAALAAPPCSQFRQERGGWLLSYDGEEVHLPEAKGLRDLWQVIGAHGADVGVLTLLGVAEQTRTLGADPVLDSRAKAEYKARLARLEEQIDDAEAAGAVAAAEALRAERGAVLGYLVAATGLGGRDRRLGDEAERARKTVSARVRDSLARVERIHPTLAAHLRSSVRMGTTCAYVPAEPVSWRLR